MLLPAAPLRQRGVSECYSTGDYFRSTPDIHFQCLMVTSSTYSKRKNYQLQLQLFPENPSEKGRNESTIGAIHSDGRHQYTYEKRVWMFQQHEDILIFSFDCILLRMSGPIPSAINGCTGDDTKGETQYLCPFVGFLFDWAQRDLVS